MKIHHLAVIAILIGSADVSSAADDAGTAQVVEAQDHKAEEWLTDLNAARVKAKKLNRPLLISTNVSWSGPDKKQMQAILNDSSIAAVIDERFVKVQLSDQGEPITTLKIERFPTIIFCAPDMTELLRDEGLNTKKEMRDLLARGTFQFERWSIDQAAAASRTPTTDSKSKTNEVAQKNPLTKAEASTETAKDPTAPPRTARTPLIVTEEVERGPWTRDQMASWLQNGTVRRPEAAEGRSPKMSLVVSGSPNELAGGDPRQALVTRLSELDVPPLYFAFTPSASRARRDRLDATLVLSADTDPEVGQKIVSVLKESSVTTTTNRRPTVSLWFIRSSLESAGPEAAKDWQRVLRDMGTDKKSDQKPSLDSETLFASDVALVYERKKASTVLSWLKGHNLVLEVKTPQDGDSDQIVLPASISQDENRGDIHVERTRNWSWTVDEKNSLRSSNLRQLLTSQFARGPGRSSESSGSDPVMDITRSLALFEKWRGEAKARPANTLLQSSFAIDLPVGMVAMLNAFPSNRTNSSGDDINSWLHSTSKRFGYLPLLVIENHAFEQRATGDLFGAGVLPELVAPDRASPIRITSNNASASVQNDLRTLGPLIKTAEQPVEQPTAGPKPVEIPTPTPSSPPNVKMVRLYNADSIALSSLLTQVVRKEGFVASADPRTNSVVVTSPDDETSMLAEALLAKLDEQKSARDTSDLLVARRPSLAQRPTKPLVDLQKDYADREKTVSALATELRTLMNLTATEPTELALFSSNEFFNQADRDERTFVDELHKATLGRPARVEERTYWIGRFNALNGNRSQLVRDFLASVRPGTPAAGNKVPPNEAALREKLAAAVNESFNARQAMLAAELETLKSKIESTEQSLELRNKAAAEIVARRVEDLLNPQLQWDTLGTVLAAGTTPLPSSTNPLSTASGGTSATPDSPFKGQQNPQATGSGGGQFGPARGKTGSTSKSAPRTASASSSFGPAGARGSSANSLAGQPGRKLRSLVVAGLNPQQIQTITEDLGLSADINTTAFGASADIQFSATDEEYQKLRAQINDAATEARQEVQVRAEAELLKQLTGIWDPAPAFTPDPIQGGAALGPLAKLVIHDELAATFEGNERKRLWTLKADQEGRYTFTAADGQLGMQGSFDKNNDQLRVVFVGTDGAQILVYNRTISAVPPEWVTDMQKAMPRTKAKPWYGTDAETQAADPLAAPNRNAELLRGLQSGTVRRGNGPTADSSRRNPSDYLELVRPYADVLAERDELRRTVGDSHSKTRARAAEFTRAEKALDLLKKEFETELQAAASQLALKRASLDTAKAELDRMQKLRQSNAATQIDLQRKELEFKDAETLREAAELRLKLLESTREGLFPQTPASTLPSTPIPVPVAPANQVLPPPPEQQPSAPSAEKPAPVKPKPEVAAPASATPPAPISPTIPPRPAIDAAPPPAPAAGPIAPASPQESAPPAAPNASP